MPKASLTNMAETNRSKRIMKASVEITPQIKGGLIIVE